MIVLVLHYSSRYESCSVQCILSLAKVIKGVFADLLGKILVPDNDMKYTFLFLFGFIFLGDACTGQERSVSKPYGAIRTGAEQTELYFPILQSQAVGVVCNQTSTIGDVHLVDSLKGAGIDLRAIFSPEHGFRGDADAGAKIGNSVDPKTELPIYSLYGKDKKPSANTLRYIDVMVFDIQDVGARFYTYISTLHYVMEACAEMGITLLILDRPNPNGFYVDGPVLDMKYKSFVGMHPVPVVHGMTIGEYAQMINGEKWLKGGVQCPLNVISCRDYDHTREWPIAIAPSPNLRTQNAIYLYPSLCFFEGTEVSVGRGTKKPFEIIGSPKSTIGIYQFVPESVPGATSPKNKGEKCMGFNLKGKGNMKYFTENGLELSWLIDMYNGSSSREGFFDRVEFFDKLAGTDALRKAIIAGKTEAEIKKGWQESLNDFKKKRKQYLLYPDFE